MKRALLLLVVLLAGCSLFKRTPPPVRRPAPIVKPAAPVLTDAGGAEIERTAFRTGVSSATVEKMAKERGCTGGQGAGLMTQTGPIEVYQMRCEDGAMRGKVFTARCELRQCVKM